MLRWLGVIVISAWALSPAAFAGEQIKQGDRAQATAEAKPDPMAGIKIREMLVGGTIDGENVDIHIAFDVTTDAENRQVPLIRGDVVLQSIDEPADGRRLKYDPKQRTYYLVLAGKGTRRVAASFAARPKKINQADWREAAFEVPASQLRRITVEADRTDLQVKFPHAMRVTREVAGGKLVLGAILGPGKPFTLQWKPQVQTLDAKLVASVEANTVGIVSAGTLKHDTLFVVDIAQGKLSELKLAVPKALSITQVRGEYIRDWSIAGEGDRRTLTVSLNREQTSRYALQVLAEMAVPAFPSQVDLPVVQPIGLHTRGNLVIGTNSAVALVVDKTSGLSQIDNATFPRMVLRRDLPRPLPMNKAFSYTYASMPYRMKLSLDDIVPSYDVTQQLAVSLKEDDLIVDGNLTLDVRDAPVRSLIIETPAQMNVANVVGPVVADYRVLAPINEGGPKRIEIEFAKPVLGSTAIGLRLELGRTPLDRPRVVTPPSVVGAKTQRGFLAVAAEQSVRIDRSAASDEEKLKSVHTGSVPMRVPNAQYAYRFRDTGWSLALAGSRREAGVVVETFNLISLGEGIAYGTVAANYFVTGSPIDEFKFVVPAELRNVEFVGRDIARKRAEGNVWTIKLNRKIIGDYNLAVTFNQRYADGGPVTVGAVRCADVDRQSGYVVMTSHLNLALTAAAQATAPGALIEIDREEVPANYRLLAHSPILRCFKYAAAPVPATVTVKAFDRASLLPAVVEILEVRTDLALSEEGEAESITRTLYNVKNTSRQFLELLMPAGAKVLHVNTVTLDGQGNAQSHKRLAVASAEGNPDKLLIPLRRNLNPNEPVIIQLEYSQTHGKLGWSGRLPLEAPRTAVPATYADWRVTVPEEWSVRGAGGNMVAASEQASQMDLAWVGSQVIRGWYEPLRRFFTQNSAGQNAVTLVVAGAVLLIASLLALRFWRRYTLDQVMCVALALLLAWGLAALNTGLADTMSNPPADTHIAFTQAVKADVTDAAESAKPLQVELMVVPGWRQHARLTGSVVMPIVALLSVLLMLFVSRWRVVFAVAAFVAAVYAASQFHVMALPLAHVLTWGIPATLLAGYIWRAMIRPPESVIRAAAVGTMLLLYVGLPGCFDRPWVPPIDYDQPVIDRVDVDLLAEDDSMSVKMGMTVTAGEPMRFTLLDQRAVLMSSDRPDPNVRIERVDERYEVRVLKAGVYRLSTEWLTPVAEADADRVRRFHMPLPMALANRVTLTVPERGLDVACPTAIKVSDDTLNGSTVTTVSVGPTDPVSFVWKPRARQLDQEQTVFYADAMSVYRCDSGLIQGRHQLDLKIAQGQVKDIRVALNDGLTVTAVEGAHLGAWRYDPITHELEVRLSRPASGDYRLKLSTQRSLERLPIDLAIGGLSVADATRQHARVGMITSPMVYIETERRAGMVNVDDFARDAAELLKAFGAPTPVRYAYRVKGNTDTVPLTVHKVRSEVRAQEITIFSVADDKLMFNGQVTIDIAKAGRFSSELYVPDSFDIDALSAPQVSHWDEQVEGGRRRVVVHYKQNTLGRVALNITLSRSVTSLPRRIDVPRIEVVGAVKHTGVVKIRPERGISLTVTDRKGVSELRAVDVNLKTPGALAYKLLRPDWSLSLETEVVEPLITAEFLHRANVSEGIVRHVHHVRYRLQNAGTKFFEVDLPEDAVGVQVLGQSIARREQVSPGRWRIELTGKYFKPTYLLEVRYETQHDRKDGRLTLEPVVALGTDRQRGHIVIDKTDRLELRPTKVGRALRPADARSIRDQFGAPDLSSAAYCYASLTPAYELELSVKRLTSAQQLEATVEFTELRTVITETGQSINRVQMRLRVGSKRLLETRLPTGAEIWSLSVNGRSVAPSHHVEGGEQVLLVPLALASLGELPVDVELVYVMNDRLRWDGRINIDGPRFDLPLRGMRWLLFVPPGFRYDDFEGTLAINEAMVDQPKFAQYNVGRYRSNVVQANRRDYEVAQQLQRLGNQYATEVGGQYKARQALELALNNSTSSADLNEDIRVDLYNLRRQQTKVGLVGTRDRLRFDEVGNIVQGGTNDLGDNYSLKDADRIVGTLSLADNENLDTITRRLIDIQEEASGQAVQLAIDLPLRGRVLEFTRPLQVKENAPMSVGFAASQPVPASVSRDLPWVAGMFAVLSTILLAGGWMMRRWSWARDRLKQKPQVAGADSDENARE